MPSYKCSTVDNEGCAYTKTEGKTHVFALCLNEESACHTDNLYNMDKAPKSVTI